MPPPNLKTVKIKIHGTKHFTDGPRLWGPGEWDVTPEEAESLVSQGKAKVLKGSPATKAPVKEPEKTQEKNSRVQEKKAGGDSSPTETALPEDFPSRELLVSAGLGTVESLKTSDVKDKIALVEGLTPADVTKIGLAISKI